MANYISIGYLSAAVILTMSALSSSAAIASKLGSPQYYALAKKNLAKDTMLGPDCISIGSTTESKDMPPNAMWLSAPEEAYGFKIHNARGANEPISGSDLLAPGYNDPTPKPTDPLWLKYAKSSVVCDKKGDFALSRRYEEGALTELEKLGKVKKRLVYMDDANWIFQMQTHMTEGQHSGDSAVQALNRQKAAMGNNQVPDLQALNKLAQEMKTHQRDQFRTREARNKRLYSVLSPVLPPQCQMMRFVQRDLEEDAVNARRYAK